MTALAIDNMLPAGAPKYAREALRAWFLSRRPVSRWRSKAREVIGFTILGNEDLGPKELLAAIEAAYPFGEREHHPYKAWRAEIAIIKSVLLARPEPTRDEAAACEVAADLLEQTGDVAAVQRLLAEQAPNRLARTCLACAAAIGRPCFDLEMEAVAITAEDAKIAGLPLPATREIQKRITRLVPHVARVGIAPTGAALGPLFGGLP